MSSGDFSVIRMERRLCGGVFKLFGFPTYGRSGSFMYKVLFFSSVPPPHRIVLRSSVRGNYLTFGPFSPMQFNYYLSHVIPNSYKPGELPWHSRIRRNSSRLAPGKKDLGATGVLGGGVSPSHPYIYIHA